MTVSIDQANALIKEYAELIKTQQGEIIQLQREISELKATIEELNFEMSCELNKEYDV
jgi:peptidoglycan hydrolase CwlO-like protein